MNVQGVAPFLFGVIRSAFIVARYCKHSRFPLNAAADTQNQCFMSTKTKIAPIL